MSKEKQTQDALLEAIDIAVENKLKKLGFNYYVDGVIKGKNIDNTYNVLINGEIYNNVPSKNNFEYSVNDVVQVLIKNGNWNKKFVDDKKNHNEIPQNILNLEQDISNMQSTYLNMGKRIRIKASEDFNDYTEIGSYCVLADSDAKTISNIPMGVAGILNVYSSNGGDIYTAQYIYLIQEYTTLTGNYKFIRHIRQTPTILEDTTTYPKGWDFRDWEVDVNSHTLSDSVVIKNTLLDLIYPIGSIYMSVNNVSPQTFLGGTWTKWGSGRVPVGVNTSDSNFSTVEKTGGSSTVTLTKEQMPSHTHGTGDNNFFTTNADKDTDTIGRRKVALDSNSGVYAMTADPTASDYTTSGGFSSIDSIANTGATGNSKSHNNLQPYITCYMWKRTA